MQNRGHEFHHNFAPHHWKRTQAALKDVLHNTKPADFFYKGQVCNYSKKGLYFESNMDLLPEDEISILVKRGAVGETHILDIQIVWYKELQDSSFNLGYGAMLRGRRKIDVR